MESLPRKRREEEIYKVTLIGSVVNFVLLLAKFTAGIFGRSAAMIADAVHSLSDFVTDAIVIVLVRISGKPEDENHRYGHGKFETFATFFIGIILLGVGILIGYNAVVKIIVVVKGAQLESPGMIAFWAAIISIIAKEILYRYTVGKGKKLNSDAVIANGWHHRSDAYSSIGTAIGIGGAIFLGEKWIILDPLAAFVVSVFIVKSAFQLMKSPFDELTEKTIPEEIENRIVQIVDSFDGVSNLHNLHTRKIGTIDAIEFHIRMNGMITIEQAHRIITEIEKRLKEEFGADTHIMIHPEPLKNSFETSSL